MLICRSSSLMSLSLHQVLPAGRVIWWVMDCALAEGGTARSSGIAMSRAGRRLEINVRVWLRCHAGVVIVIFSPNWSWSLDAPVETRQTLQTGRKDNRSAPSRFNQLFLFDFFSIDSPGSARLS